MRAGLVLSSLLACACAEPTVRAGAPSSGRAADAEPQDEGASPLDALAPDALAADASQLDASALDASQLDAFAPDALAPDAGFSPRSCHPSFGRDQACGGDPTGEWPYRAACTDDNPLAALRQICPDATIAARRDVSGALSLHAGGAYSRRSRVMSTWNVNLPVRCVQGTCSSYGDALGQLVGASVSLCNVRSFTCECVLEADQRFDSAGTWSAASGVLELDATGGGRTELWFCAADGALQHRARTPGAPDEKLSFVLRP